MLNRTNRTLSANLNRLNLGTRSLALSSALNGKIASRIHQAHDFSMRDGMFRSVDPSIARIRIDLPSVPGSTQAEPWPVQGGGVQRPVVVSVSRAASAFRTATAPCLAAAAAGG